MIGLTHDDDHVYTAHYPPTDPVNLVSITTAMKALDKPAIVNWARNLTAEKAVDNLDILSRMVAEGGKPAAAKYLASLAEHKRDTKADIGTRVHTIAEAIAKGIAVEPQPDELPYVNAFRSWMDDFQPRWVAVEYMVCNLTEGYAGTGDDVVYLQCPIDGKEDRWRIDKKTMGVNDRGQPKGPYRETALQLAAAEFAEFCGRPDDPKKYVVPAAEHCGVLALVEDGTYRLVPYVVDKTTYRAFLDTLGAWRWLTGQARTVMGQALKPLAQMKEAA